MRVWQLQHITQIHIKGRSIDLIMEGGERRVVFASRRLEDEYEALARSKLSADRKLYSTLKRVRRILLRRCQSGTEIPKERIPTVYRRQFGVFNLWCLSLWPYSLVLYSMVEEDVLIIDML